MHPATDTMETTHSFHPSILREYDIRGIVDETLHPEDAYFVGRGFASIVLEENAAATIAIARDGRLSSPKLAEAMIQGITEAGANVVDCGLGPTPMLYFAVHHLNAAGGIMITGSHNPPTHNGFKMMKGKLSFFGEAIRALGERVQTGNLASGKGSIEQQDVKPYYLTSLLGSSLQGSSNINAAWDPGNGAAGEMVELIAAKLGGKQTTIYTEIDGTFPNHHPDPSVPENLEHLVKTVKQNGCDVGLAFDGDGDRLGVVDDTGRMVSSDHLLMLFARDVLQANPKAQVIADVKTSQTVFDDITSHSGRPLMYKTGHSHIKSKMKETGAPFAGEASGHIFFLDRYFGFDDGLYAALRMINLLAHSNRKLSDMVDALPSAFSTPEIRIDCAEERKFAIIDEVKTRLQQEGASFSDIDGVRVNTPQGWWLLRASNTQAAIIARAESGNQTDLQTLTDALRSQLKQSGISLNIG